MAYCRTPLTIFSLAAWVETCCYAPKVWCFQSRARSTSHCLPANSFEMFFFPYFYLLSNICWGLMSLHPESHQSEQNSEGFSTLFLFLSHYHLLLTNISCYNADAGFSLFHLQLASCMLKGIYRDCCSHLYKLWLLALFSWVVYCIHVFLPHRLWPWGRTAVVTTTFWPILWVITEPLPWEEVEPAFAVCDATKSQPWALMCLHNKWIIGFCMKSGKNRRVYIVLLSFYCIYLSYYIYYSCLINHNLASDSIFTITEYAHMLL